MPDIMTEPRKALRALWIGLHKTVVLWRRRRGDAKLSSTTRRTCLPTRMAFDGRAKLSYKTTILASRAIRDTQASVRKQ